MKCTSNKQKNATEMIEQVQKLLTERGSKALEEARKTILQEEVECKEVREALTYFMQEYWQDLARPTLLSLACEAVGGDPDVTTSIAVPMILISGAVDIHDDIIDESEIKESRPTVLGKFGKDIALLVGDALLFRGLTLLHEAVEKGIPAERLSVIIGILKNMFFELGDAEALELRFRGRVDVTPEEYLHVVKKKAADVESYTRISAIIGGGSEEEIETLGRYGRILGMMAILRDDLTDMLDYKEAVHRIRKECLPLPILFTLRNPGARAKVEAVLQKKTIKRKDAELILEISHKIGGIERFQSLIKELQADAYSNISDLRYSKQYLALLIDATILPLYRRTGSNARI